MTDPGGNMSDTVTDAVQILVDAVPDPNTGLPDEIFYYISRTTPFINVDLLIKDAQGRTLLAWRDDEHAGLRPVCHGGTASGRAGPC